MSHEGCVRPFLLSKQNQNRFSDVAMFAHVPQFWFDCWPKSTSVLVTAKSWNVENSVQWFFFTTIQKKIDSSLVFGKERPQSRNPMSVIQLNQVTLVTALVHCDICLATHSSPDACSLNLNQVNKQLETTKQFLLRFSSHACPIASQTMTSLQSHSLHSRIALTNVTF